MFALHFSGLCSYFDVPQSVQLKRRHTEPGRPTPHHMASHWSFGTLPEGETTTTSPQWRAVLEASPKLCQVYSQALELGLLDEAKALLKAIIVAAKRYHVDYFKQLFLPFLRSIPAVWREKRIAFTELVCKELFESVLMAYSQRYLGSKPIGAPDWARSRVVCPCKDCEMLNSFIASPTQKVGRFAMGKSRRQHLHMQLDRIGGSYTHITERVGNPQTLVVTKTNTDFNAKLRDWRKRHAEAQWECEQIGLEVLRTILGQRFEQIIDLSDADDGSKAKRGASTASQQNGRPPVSSALKADTATLATGGMPGSKRKLVDIIDIID
jgi:hypothetical protein